MYEPTKRLFDIAISLIGLLFLSPLFLIIAILILIDSPGPVFYRGERTGQYGKRFRIFKFRSMVVDAEKGAGSTAQNDTRVTQIGHFIRRYKIDELPQLINVLIGEMSLVGPRPELPRYTDQYKGDELLILNVRPGITDYSSIRFIQLSDALGKEDPDRAYEENILQIKNRLRVQYVRDRNFYIDLRLLIKTITKIGKRNWNIVCLDKPASKSVESHSDVNR
jgi:lipopolysaccharide/colanic/teichoic acid biosynthesis glycosyltransferase